ncbi:hypothetical protein Sros01_72630 [Streptomyces roseochromogenus]|nr:hypothetical protein Sros01_72630 [Streptomyces roseochromogenus]
MITGDLGGLGTSTHARGAGLVGRAVRANAGVIPACAGSRLHELGLYADGRLRSHASGESDDSVPDQVFRVTIEYFSRSCRSPQLPALSLPPP